MDDKKRDHQGPHIEPMLPEALASRAGEAHQEAHPPAPIKDISEHRIRIDVDLHPDTRRGLHTFKPVESGMELPAIFGR